MWFLIQKAFNHLLCELSYLGLVSQESIFLCTLLGSSRPIIQVDRDASLFRGFILKGIAFEFLEDRGGAFSHILKDFNQNLMKKNFWYPFSFLSNIRYLITHISI